MGIRISKEEYYLNIAKDVAKRGTCIRRNYGAVIVKDNRIVSTGYTGSPKGCPNCCDVGKCERERLNIPSGQRYELCKSVHAEQNAIIKASAEELDGAVLVLCGIDSRTGEVLNKSFPCDLCQRMIINAGISTIVYYENGKVNHTYVHELVKLQSK